MKINILSKRLLPLVVLGVLLILAFLAFKNPPEADRRAKSNGPRIAVETLELAVQPYQVILQSYGTVRPRTQSMLVSQVSGQIIWLNSHFRDGGFIEEGETLLRIDPRDYEADVKIAEASMLDAQQALAEEEARSIQAREDWQRLGNTGGAPDLVLRKPQLMAAKARVISAESALTKARLNLERTQITAPFAGRVLSQNVDLGQVVSNNSQLGEIYATDYVEIRLPIRNHDLSFIDLPEHQITETNAEPSGLNARIVSNLGLERSWPSQIIRTEGAIDESARQLHIVAQVKNPFEVNTLQERPLKIGEYVTAQIQGSLLEQVLVIPNSAIYQGSYVYVVEGDILRRRNINILWQNEQDSIVGEGLVPGDLLVTTSLGQVTSGTRVNVLQTEDVLEATTNSGSLANQPDDKVEIKPPPTPEAEQSNDGDLRS